MKYNRVDNCVMAGDLGVGEDVIVRTLMGEEVYRGAVIASNPAGVSVQESGGSSAKFFNSDLHVFTVNEPPQLEVFVGKLDSMTPDQRVAYKLGKMMSESKSGAEEKEEKEESDEDEGEGDEKDKKARKKPDTKKDNGDDVDMAQDKEVKIDKLPEEIKNAIIDVDELEGERLNGVIGDIGDASMKALRRAGVAEDGIYDIVSKIQKAIISIVSPGKGKK